MENTFGLKKTKMMYIMSIVSTEQVPACRLRQELRALGKETWGSRSELVSRLTQCGIYDLNVDVPPLPPKIDTTSRNPNTTCVYIGNGAGKYNKDDNKLYIANCSERTLIEGDFVQEKVTISKVLSLNSTDNLSADTEGTEGDIRRLGQTLYMFRSTDVHPGWYPFTFGPVLIV